MTEAERRADEIVEQLDERLRVTGNSLFIERMYSPRLLAVIQGYRQVKAERDRLRAERDALAELVDRAHDELSPARPACLGLVDLPKEQG